MKRAITGLLTLRFLRRHHGGKGHGLRRRHK
jgi:hypothetical protein